MAMMRYPSFIMSKLCAVEVAIPIQICFSGCIYSDMFPDCWKYANVQLLHKKDNRQIKGNYRLISLLPISYPFVEKSGKLSL